MRTFLDPLQMDLGLQILSKHFLSVIQFKSAFLSDPS